RGERHAFRAGNRQESNSLQEEGNYGSENTYSIPPFVVYLPRSLMAFRNPSAPVPSTPFNPPETAAPDHPPTPESTATYCLPSGPLYVTGCPMMPDPTLNFQSGFPFLASIALNQPSMVP